MLTGRETLREIDSHVNQAQLQIQKADREANELKEHLNRLRLEETEQYRKLAELRLDQIRAGTMTARLDEAQTAAVAFMEQHKQALSDLEKEIGQAQQDMRTLEKKRESKLEECEVAEDALEQRIRESKESLEKTVEYQDLQEKTQVAAEVARRANEKASRVEAELEMKGKPYMDDDLFRYLWNRRYFTPDYRHWGVIRMLDSWVARLIDFKKTRADYHMLNELPRGLRAHAEKAAEEAERLRQSLSETERRAAEKDGLKTFQDSLEATEEQLQKINTEMETAENRYRLLVRKKNEYAAGDDEDTQKALAIITSELEREDAVALLRQARSTPMPEDDAVANRLSDIQEELRALERRLSELKDLQRKQYKALEELAVLRDRFRRTSYDSPRSSFPIDIGLGLLLGGILSGGRSSGNAWERIDRSQRWNKPRRGGGFGGFGTGGGFKGGGFRTGGRF